VIRVELIRAWPRRCDRATLELADDATVADALHASRWEPDPEFSGLAVFGSAATMATALHDGDRVELLRGLQVDPKQARRLRAQRRGKPA
jgi:putative ubiquitin-RnfH superfamily antitoxin RatB of RatAB toxin-antitoxin module